MLQIVYTLDACGGIENYVMNYYRQFNKEKIQVDFIIHKNTSNNFIEEVKKLGGKVYIFPEFSFKNLFKILKLINKFFKVHKYKIIHCHVAPAACFYFYFAKKHKILHRILHAHQPAIADKIKNKIRDFVLLNLGNYFATDRIACSDTSGKFLFKNKKFIIVYNAIDFKKYLYSPNFREMLRNKYSLKNQKVIGHIGRFAPVKNHKFLLNIFENVLKIDKEYKLMLIGDGETKEEIKKLCYKKNLDSNVIFVDTTKEAYKYYSVFDIFLLPSFFEGLPLVAIEAQYNGLPVILSKNRVTKDVIISDKVELLSIESSPRLWAEKIIEIINNNKVRQNKIFSDDYNIYLQANKLEDYYVNLVNGET